MKTKKDNVAGVNLPNFEAFQVGLLTYLDSTSVFQINAFDIFHKQDGSDSNELAGLAKGGQQFKRLKVNPTLKLEILQKHQITLKYRRPTIRRQSTS